MVLVGAIIERLRQTYKISTITAVCINFVKHNVRQLYNCMCDNQSKTDWSNQSNQRAQSGLMGDDSCNIKYMGEQCRLTSMLNTIPEFQPHNRRPNNLAIAILG